MGMISNPLKEEQWTPESLGEDYRQGTALPEEADALTDLPPIMGRGLMQLGRTMEAGVEYVDEKLGRPEAAAYWRSQQRDLDREASEYNAAITKEGRAAADASFFPEHEGDPSVWDDPIRSLGYKLAGQAPMIGVATAGSVVLSAVAPVIGPMVVAGLMGEGEIADAVNQGVDDTSDEDLMKSSQVFRTMVEDGKSPEEARLRVKEMIKDETVPWGSLFLAGLGPLGTEAMLAKAITGNVGKQAGKGFIKGAVKGAVESGITEGIEEAPPAIAGEIAGQEGGKPINWWSVANQVAEGAGLGVVTGGVAGAAEAARGGEVDTEAEPAAPRIEQVAPSTPNAAETAAFKPKEPAPATGQPPAAPAVVTPPEPTTGASGVTQVPLDSGDEAIRAALGGHKPRGKAAQEALLKREAAELAAKAKADAEVATPEPNVVPNVGAASPVPPAGTTAPTAAVPAPTSPPVPATSLVQPQRTQPPFAPTAQGDQPGSAAQAPAGPLPPFVSEAEKAAVAPAEETATTPQDMAALVNRGTSKSPIVGPRILPDISKKKATEEQLTKEGEAQAKAQARGTRYDPEDRSPSAVYAWRLQRINEVKRKGDKASDIAKAVAKITGKQGQKFTAEQNAELDRLHAQDLEQQAKPATQPVQKAETAPVTKSTEIPKKRGQGKQYAVPGTGKVVTSPENYVREAAKETQQDEDTGLKRKAIDRANRLLRAIDATERPELKAQLNAHPLVKAARAATEDDTDTFEQAEEDTLQPTLEELKATQFDTPLDREIGATGGQIVGEISETPRASGAKPTAQNKNKFKAKAEEIAEKGKVISGKQVSAEEKARILAELQKAQSKKGVEEEADTRKEDEREFKSAEDIFEDRGKAEKEEVERKTGEKQEELPEQVTEAPKAARIKAIAKKKAEPAPAKAQPEVGVAPDKVARIKEINKQRLEKRKAELDEAGKELLQLREAARDAARSGSPDLQRLLDAVHIASSKVEQKHGRAALKDLQKQVEAVLKAGNRAVLPGPTPTTWNEFLKEVDAENSTVAKMARDGYTPRTQVKTVHTTTIADVLDNKLDFARFSKTLAQHMGTSIASVNDALAKMFTPRYRERVGNMPFHVITDKDWQDRGFTKAGAFYDPVTRAVYMPEKTWDSPLGRAQVTMHEVAHAVFVDVVESVPGVREDVKHMMATVDAATANWPDRKYFDYGLTSVDEFIAEAFSNPRFQQMLAEIPMSKYLANVLNMKNWHGKSVWQGFVDLVRRTFKLGPGQYSMLEGIIHAVEAPAGRLVGIPESFTSSPDPFVRDLEQYRQATGKDILYGPMGSFMDKVQSTVSEARDAKPGTLSKAMLALRSLHQKAQLADRYFPKNLGLGVSDATEQQRVRKKELVREGSDDVVTPMHKLKDKMPEQFAEMVDLALLSTGADFHPDRSLDDNKHITDNVRWDYARRHHPEAAARWDKLPQELKAVWKKTNGFTGKYQNMLAKQLIENMVETALGKPDSQLAERIHNGKLTEADRNLFKTNKALRSLSQARELARINGFYVPLMRHGEHIVTAKYKMPKQWDKFRDIDADGKVIEDGTYRFENEADYEKFLADMDARGLHYKPSMQTVDATTGSPTYTDIDPKTGVNIKTKSGKDRLFRYVKGDPNTKQVWRVFVQTQLMEAHDSLKSAYASQKALRADSNYGEAALQQKKDLNFGNMKGTSAHLRSAMKRMQQTPGWSRSSEVQRSATTQAMIELSLNFLASTAPQQRARPRRNVIGAGKDLVRNMAQYTSSMSGAIAKAEFQPKLDRAYKAMDDYAERNKHDDKAYARSQILDSMRGDTNSQELSPHKLNRLGNSLLTISFIDKLASTGHFIINELQPWMVSMPVIGGKHGFVKSGYEMGRAYKDMGYGTILKTGVKDTITAITDHLEGTTDYIADIKKNLSKVTDGAELGKMLQYLYERGLIDMDAGLEVAELVDAPSGLESFLHRVDHVVRQSGTAAEVANRVATAITAYRLERASGSSIQDALVYTQETVSNTQGNYSFSNAPKAFKHPLARMSLQFKKYPQMMYHLLAKLTYNVFKGETKEVKLQAAKSLTGLLAMHVAFAGALGLPTEPIKYPWMLLSAFLPMPKWDDIEQQATEYAQALVGDTLGDAVMKGLPRLAGWDLSNRVSMSSMAAFGGPRSDRESDVKKYLWDTVAGAPAALVSDWVKATYDISEGKFGDAAEKMIPVKQFADALKAYRRATEGTYSKRGEQTSEGYGIWPAVTQFLGIKPTEEAQRQEKTAAFYSQKGQRDTQRRALMNEFLSGVDRPGVRKKIIQFNKGLPPDARITMKAIETLAKRKVTEKQKGYVKKGVYGGRINKDLLDKYIGQ